MIEYFEKNWWLWSLRGLVAVIFGCLAFALPMFNLMTLILFFSGFMFADGVFALLSLFAERTDERWSWAVFFEGLAGIVGGTLICLVPEVSILFLIYCFAAWASFSGIMKITSAVHCRKTPIVPGTWLLGFSGLGSLALGLYLTSFPQRGLLQSTWMCGLYGLFLGILMLLEGLRLKRFYRIFDVRKVHSKVRQPYYPA